MKIYTKTGDDGTTSLVGGQRCPKYDERVEAYGTVDELMAFVALLRDKMNEYRSLKGDCKDLQFVNNDLMTIAALLASDCADDKVGDLDNQNIAFLEERIDNIDAGLEPLKTFTLPGGHELVSLAHVCRTVCRRAERAALRAAADYPTSHNALTYLNRLSDYLYILARKLSGEFNVKETYWVLEK